MTKNEIKPPKELNFQINRIVALKNSDEQLFRKELTLMAEVFYYKGYENGLKENND